jgi:hypothetical protein
MGSVMAWIRLGCSNFISVYRPCSRCHGPCTRGRCLDQRLVHLHGPSG